MPPALRYDMPDLDTIQIPRAQLAGLIDSLRSSNPSSIEAAIEKAIDAEARTDVHDRITAQMPAQRLDELLPSSMDSSPNVIILKRPRFAPDQIVLIVGSVLALLLALIVSLAT